MDQNERDMIDDLFARLRQAEGCSGARDAEAEALIAQHIARQPAAPYYMAQAIVVQQDALANAQTKMQELERQLEERPSGGFLSGLFGGGQESAAVPGGGATGPVDRGRYHQAGAGSFLGGAMQTALGVAGGFLIADALTELLSTDEAAAGPIEADTATDVTPWEDQRVPAGEPDLAEDDGGDFDAGGFDADF